MTGAGALLNVLKPTASSTICIVGAGAVGLAAIMAVKLLSEQPRRVIAVDVVASRLEMARKYGATDVIDSSKLGEGGLKTELLRFTEGEGVAGSIDCTGRAEVVNTLIEASAKRGMVVSVGVGGLDANAEANIFNTVNKGVVYTGCCMGSCYPQEFIPMLIQAEKEGKFPFTDLIKTFKVEDVEEVIKGVHHGSVVKAVLTWE